MNISPNAVLKDGALIINGQQQDLRHVDDLITFAVNTVVAVCSVLDAVFPSAVAVPRGEEAHSSTRSAWRDYSL